MPEEQNTQTDTVTPESIQQMVNTALAGYAAKNEKHLNKIVDGFTQQLNEVKGDPKPEGNHNPDPAVAVLQRKLEELTKSHEEARIKTAKAEKDSALSKVLSTFSFANEVSRDTAFKVFAGDIQQTNDGQYVIGDQPLSEAVKARMGSLTGLLAPVAVSGSGSGSSTTAQNNSGTVTLEQIRGAKGMDQLRAVAEKLQKMSL
jgi:hypothetical protein